MASAMFSFGEFNFGKRVDEFGPEFNTLCSDLKFYSNKSSGLDDFTFNAASPPLEACLEEISRIGVTPICPTQTDEPEPKKLKHRQHSLASLEILKNYGTGIKRLDGERIVEPSDNRETEKLSLEEIVRFAGMKFIQTSSDCSSIEHPFGLSFSGLSDEEIKDVQLVELLLVCAEKVSYQQYDRARNLLNHSSYLFSKKGTPIQRLVYYFAEGLHDRIDRETGRFTRKDLYMSKELELDLVVMSPTSYRIAYHQQTPFTQVFEFAGIQAIIEGVANAKKIHAIDLCVGSGLHWTILMQALASVHGCELELLKITAIGTTSTILIEETGKRLSNFARTMNIPFSFKLAMVNDISNLDEDDFDIDADETVVVFSLYFLRNLIHKPDRLDSLMKVISRLNPIMMVVIEAEANHNHPSIVNRFIEALFFYSVHFDYLDAFMGRDDDSRLTIESFYFGHGIRNIVGADGNDRNVRNVTIDVWRSFFSRFGMNEVELSASSLYQASLVIKRFKHERCCTLDLNGKCLLVGWKNTPIQSLSIWKFS